MLTKIIVFWPNDQLQIEIQAFIANFTSYDIIKMISGSQLADRHEVDNFARPGQLFRQPSQQAFGSIGPYPPRADLLIQTLILL